MDVDSRDFLQDIAVLRKQRIIVRDKEIVEATGASKGNVSSYLAGNVKPSKNFLEKFYEVYGKHLNQSSLSSNAVAIDISGEHIMMVPLVNKYAYAGYLSGYGDAEYIEELPKHPFIVDKEYKGNYVAFEVKGDSMDDGTRASYLEGDILLCREVPKHHWQSKLHINRWDFVIVTKDDGIVVKQIVKHDAATGDIVIHSRNELYEDRQLNLKNIAQIFNIVQVAIKK